MEKWFTVKGAAKIATLEKASVKNVFQTSNALYFRTADGFGARLIFEGVKGWRLQVNANGSAKFEDLGASQSLAAFMNEPYKTAKKPLSVRVGKTSVTVTEQNGSKAILSLGKRFSLAFVAKDGTVVSEVLGFRADGTYLGIYGALEDGEAVYGGGERFNVVNKRGVVMDLYSCDGWNDSSTSYVVVPAFFTSRGGGMFLNRYEASIADFGVDVGDQWSVKLKSDVLDCYFYASTNPADTLRGYTELAGHAHMPTPWMQGVQICRYWPDLSTFDLDLSYDTLEELAGDTVKDLYIISGDGYISVNDADADAIAAADRFFTREENGKYSKLYVKDDAGKFYKKGLKGSPGGNSVKTIMENFIKADLKPDAAIMEAFGWTNAFDAEDVDGKNREELANTVAWLHAHGLRAMAYFAVGRVRSSNVGFKEDYLIHVDVEYTHPDGTVERQENTTAIPQFNGTGMNPDVGRTANGFRTGRYLDITNEEAVEWYFDQIWGEMIKIGIDGVKIDFCEGLPDHGKPMRNCVTRYRFKNPEKIVPGTEHHAYPTFFISAFCKRMNEHKAALGLDDGFMVFSRGGGIGSQRNPYMWAGDQGRQYEKLDDQLMAVVNSGLSGIPYMSYDMGGYQYWYESYHTIGKEKESALFARATEFTAFTTNVQTHGDVRHAYEMTDAVQQIYRNFMGLHTALIPYMQKYSEVACKTGMPPVRHLILKYVQDKNVYDLVDEFMLGDALLVAPILEENSFEREVYLPAGSWTNLLTDEVIEGGKTVKVAANLGQIPVFLDNNSSDVAELLPVFRGLYWNAIKNWR